MGEHRVHDVRRGQAGGLICAWRWLSSVVFCSTYATFSFHGVHRECATVARGSRAHCRVLSNEDVLLDVVYICVHSWTNTSYKNDSLNPLVISKFANPIVFVIIDW